MKSLVTKVTLILALLAPMALADSPQLWHSLQQGRRMANSENEQTRSTATTTVGVSSHARGVGQPRQVVITNTSRENTGRYEQAQDAHGGFRSYYR